MSTKSIVIKWGLIGGFITIIISLLAYLTGMAESKAIQYVSVLLTLAVIVLGLFEYRDKLGSGFASFGELFKVGLMIGLIFAIISVLWTYIYSTVIDPELMETILLKTKIQFESQGLSDKEIKKALQMARKFLSPKAVAIMSLGSSLILSGFISAISALVIRNNKPEIDFE